MSSKRADLVELAKLAEQAERYEDMMNYMKEVAADEQELSSEERNLFSVAFKNVVGARRSAWRVISSSKDAEGYEGEVEEELKDLCNQVLTHIDSFLSRPVSDQAGLVFYKKMKGDYLRYIVEVTDKDDESLSPLTEKAKKAYKDAYQAALELPTTHAIRLGLALNFSVFHYEILNQPKDACALAKNTFDDAIASLDAIKEDEYKDSTLILQLLRDNLTLWQNDNAEEEADQD